MGNTIHQCIILCSQEHNFSLYQWSKKKKEKEKRKELKSALLFKNSALNATLPVGTVESVIRKGTVVARAHMKKSSTTP